MIPEFAIQLICGLSTVWCLAPRGLITSGFFRIQMLITLGLSVLFLLTAEQFPGSGEDVRTVTLGEQLIGVGLAVLSFSGSVAWTLERRKGGTMFAFAIAVLAIVALGGLASFQAATVEGFLLQMLNSLSAAWLLGSVTATMLLGHWYLTATGMSLSPLQRFNQIFAAMLIIRITVALLIIMQEPTMVSGHGWGLQTLRWAGLLGPLVLTLLTVQILKYRNTQSATGVLYAATILVFMGEMAANLVHQSGGTGV